MYIYEYYNSDSELLYVGVAKNPVKRYEEHFSKEEWAGDIRGIIVRGLYPAETARFFEKYYIKAKNPRFNKNNKLKDELFQPIADPYAFVQFNNADEMKAYFSKKSNVLKHASYYLRHDQIETLDVICYALKKDKSLLVREIFDEFIERMSEKHGRDFRAEGEQRLQM